MRRDLLVVGVATLILMLLTYALLRSATLPVPSVMTDVALLVTLLALVLILLGIVLKAPR